MSRDRPTFEELVLTGSLLHVIQRGACRICFSHLGRIARSMLGICIASTDIYPFDVTLTLQSSTEPSAFELAPNAFQIATEVQPISSSQYHGKQVMFMDLPHKDRYPGL